MSVPKIDPADQKIDPADLEISTCKPIDRELIASSKRYSAKIRPLHLVVGLNHHVNKETI